MSCGYLQGCGAACACKCHGTDLVTIGEIMCQALGTALKGRVPRFKQRSDCTLFSDFWHPTWGHACLLG